jgi:hypothetical protein
MGGFRYNVFEQIKQASLNGRAGKKCPGMAGFLSGSEARVDFLPFRIAGPVSGHWGYSGGDVVRKTDHLKRALGQFVAEGYLKSRKTGLLPKIRPFAGY